MMSLLAQIAAWLSAAANVLGKLLLAPVVENLPGWASNTIVSAVVGVVLLLIFKYTSNQKAIEGVRNKIKANILALRLFKDSLSVTFQSVGRLFQAAGMLLLHALRPMLIMVVPVSLIVAQLGLWYQARPLEPGESAVMIMKLRGDQGSEWPKVALEPTAAVEVKTGPVRVLSKREIYWVVEAHEIGERGLVFQVGQDSVRKQIAVGGGFVPVSVTKPGWGCLSILRHPRERAFGLDASVESITIEYPDRLSWNSGTDYWLVYFFVASMAFAFILKPVLRVRI